MKTVFKISSWTALVLGVLGILGSLSPLDMYGLIGCGMFLTVGAISLAYYYEQEGK